MKKLGDTLKVYKEGIQKMFSTKNGANINAEEFGEVNDKINEIWAKLKAREHSIQPMRGGLIEISSIQNNGCMQSRSAQYKTSKLFVCVCRSILDENGKFADTCVEFCPFLVYCKSEDKDDISPYKQIGIVFTLNNNNNDIWTIKDGENIFCCF